MSWIDNWKTGMNVIGHNIKNTSEKAATAVNNATQAVKENVQDVKENVQEATQKTANKVAATVAAVKNADFSLGDLFNPTKATQKLKESAKEYNEASGETFAEKQASLKSNVSYNKYDDATDGIFKTGGNVLGTAAGALAGWKLGSKFGTVGKAIGAVGIGFLGSKLGSAINETAKDIGAAQDYIDRAESNDETFSFCEKAKIYASNIANLKGQNYKGSTYESSQEAEA